MNHPQPRMNDLFAAVVRLLSGVARATGLSYEEVNVRRYFGLLPLLEAFLLDRILGKPVALPALLLGGVVVWWRHPDLPALGFLGLAAGAAWRGGRKRQPETGHCPSSLGPIE